MLSVKKPLLRWIRNLAGTKVVRKALNLDRRLDAAVVNTILHASPDSYFDCVFNRTNLLIPQHILRILAMNIHAGSDGQITVEQEMAHLLWLQRKLEPGDTFLDIGAATGSIAMPIAVSTPRVQVIAFEPSRTASRVLRETLQLNEIKSVELHQVAVSDRVGPTFFTEVDFDPTGRTSWWPEVSSITTTFLTDSPMPKQQYEVPMTTLDEFFARRTDARQVRAVKIDVEGFETKVLHGASQFLAAQRPYLAIDIHKDPFADGTTEAGVRSFLAPLGYQFGWLFHVLICSPVR